MLRPLDASASKRKLLEGQEAVFAQSTSEWIEQGKLEALQESLHSFPRVDSTHINQSPLTEANVFHKKNTDSIEDQRDSLASKRDTYDRAELLAGLSTNPKKNVSDYGSQGQVFKSADTSEPHLEKRTVSDLKLLSPVKNTIPGGAYSNRSFFEFSRSTESRHDQSASAMSILPSTSDSRKVDVVGHTSSDQENSRSSHTEVNGGKISKLVEEHAQQMAAQQASKSSKSLDDLMDVGKGGPLGSFSLIVEETNRKSKPEKAEKSVHFFDGLSSEESISSDEENFSSSTVTSPMAEGIVGSFGSAANSSKSGMFGMLADEESTTHRETFQTASKGAETAASSSDGTPSGFLSNDGEESFISPAKVVVHPSGSIFSVASPSNALSTSRNSESLSAALDASQKRRSSRKRKPQDHRIKASPAPADASSHGRSGSWFTALLHSFVPGRANAGDINPSTKTTRSNSLVHQQEPKPSRLSDPGVSMQRKQTQVQLPARPLSSPAQQSSHSKAVKPIGKHDRNSVVFVRSGSVGSSRSPRMSPRASCDPGPSQQHSSIQGDNSKGYPAGQGSAVLKGPTLEGKPAQRKQNVRGHSDSSLDPYSPVGTKSQDKPDLANHQKDAAVSKVPEAVAQLDGANSQRALHADQPGEDFGSFLSTLDSIQLSKDVERSHGAVTEENAEGDFQQESESEQQLPSDVQHGVSPIFASSAHEVATNLREQQQNAQLPKRPALQTNPMGEARQSGNSGRSADSPRPLEARASPAIPGHFLSNVEVGASPMDAAAPSPLEGNSKKVAPVVAAAKPKSRGFLDFIFGSSESSNQANQASSSPSLHSDGPMDSGGKVASGEHKQREHTSVRGRRNGPPIRTDAAPKVKQGAALLQSSKQAHALNQAETRKGFSFGYQVSTKSDESQSPLLPVHHGTSQSVLVATAGNDSSLQQQDHQVSSSVFSVEQLTHSTAPFYTQQQNTPESSSIKASRDAASVSPAPSHSRQLVSHSMYVQYTDPYGSSPVNSDSRQESEVGFSLRQASSSSPIVQLESASAYVSPITTPKAAFASQTQSLASDSQHDDRARLEMQTGLSSVKVVKSASSQGSTAGQQDCLKPSKVAASSIGKGNKNAQAKLSVRPLTAEDKHSSFFSGHGHEGDEPVGESVASRSSGNTSAGNLRQLHKGTTESSAALPALPKGSTDGPRRHTSHLRSKGVKPDKVVGTAIAHNTLDGDSPAAGSSAVSASAAEQQGCLKPSKVAASSIGKGNKNAQAKLSVRPVTTEDNYSSIFSGHGHEGDEPVRESVALQSSADFAADLPDVKVKPSREVMQRMSNGSSSAGIPSNAFAGGQLSKLSGDQETAPLLPVSGGLEMPSYVADDSVGVVVTLRSKNPRKCWTWKHYAQVVVVICASLVILWALLERVAHANGSRLPMP